MGDITALEAKVYDVRDFGAFGDGKAIDGSAINRAIDRAAAEGGGTVEIPSGTYLSYSIRLRSNITLWLAPGASIEAAEPSVDLSIGYDSPEPCAETDLYQDFGQSHYHDSLIWGEGLENVSIVGPGRIFGRGLSRGRDRRDLLPQERQTDPKERPDVALPSVAINHLKVLKPGPFGYPAVDPLPAGVGDKAIALKGCRHVILKGFTIYHGGHFCILATGVEDLAVEDVTIDTHRDGIDVNCCRNVRIANCSVNSPNDDGICLKSDYVLGRLVPTENVTITDCRVSGFDEGTMLDGSRQSREFVSGGPTGRIKCGTESNGGFRNIVISNCSFEHCRGLAIESTDGGDVQNVTVNNLVMRDIVNAPVFVRLGMRNRGPYAVPTASVRNIRISDLRATQVSGEQGIILAGNPGRPVEDVQLAHVFIEYKGGGTAAQAARIVPELINEYPDPTRLGLMPSYGLFARHVKNLRLDHVELRFRHPDRRPCLWLEDVKAVTLDELEASSLPGISIAVLKRVADLEVRLSPGIHDVTARGAIPDGALW